MSFAREVPEPEEALNSSKSGPGLAKNLTCSATDAAARPAGRPGRRLHRRGGPAKKPIRLVERGGARRRRAADIPADGQIMKDRVDRHIAVEVFPMVPRGGKRRPNLATLAMAVGEIMQDGIGTL